MHWRQAFDVEGPRDPRFSTLKRELDRAARKPDVEYEFFTGQSVTALGPAVQEVILREMGVLVDTDPDNIMKEMLQSIRTGRPPQLPGADKITIVDGVWLGREGGMDRALIGIEISNELCLVFEGAPARPPQVHYNGPDKTSAVATFRQLLPNF